MSNEPEKKSPIESGANENKILPHFWTIIKRETEEAALGSTIHGFAGMFRSKFSLLKIIWVVLFLASSAYCAYSVVISIKSYLDYEVVTNIYTYLSIPAEYPRIKVCNKNPIQTEFGYNFTRSQEDSFSMNVSEFGGIGAVEVNKFTLLSMSKALLGNESYKIGLTLDDMLISCWFKNHSCNDVAAHFVYSSNSVYGNCYNFNAGFDSNGTSRNIESVTLGGLLNGLTMELYVGAPSNIYSLSAGSGVQVFVNNQSIYDPSNGGISLAAGTFSGIEVSRVFTENVPQPYTECTSDQDIKKSNSKLVQMILSTNYDYKVTDCINLCFQDFQIQRCDCQDGDGIRPSPGVPICTDTNQTLCSVEAYRDFYIKDVRSFCAESCPVECNTVDYDLSVTSMDYPSPSYYQYLVNQSVLIKQFGNDTSAMTYDAVKRNVLGFSVHYGSMTYQRIETSQKISITDLVGQIGGFCGLFVGMRYKYKPP